MYKLELRSPLNPQDIPRMAEQIAYAMKRDPASIQRLLMKGGRIARIEDEGRARRLVQIFESAGVPLALIPMNQAETTAMQQAQRGKTSSTAVPSPRVAVASPRPQILIYTLLSLLFAGVLAFLQREHILAFANWLERSKTLALFGFALAALLLLIALLANRGRRRALGVWRAGQTVGFLSFLALAASLLLPQFPQWSGVNTLSEPAVAASDTTTTSEESTISVAVPEVTENIDENLPLVPTLDRRVVSVSEINRFFGEEPYNYQALDEWDEGALIDFRCIETTGALVNRDAICYHTLKNKEQIVRLQAISNRTGQALSEPSAITGLAAFFGSDELERVRTEAPTLSFGQAGNVVKVGNADAKLTGGVSLDGSNISAYEVSASGWDEWSKWYHFYTGRNPRVVDTGEADASAQ